MTNATSIGTKPLRFSYARLTSLLRTIQATAVAAAAAAATNNNGVSGGGSLNSSFHGVPISTDSTSALNTTITTAMEQEYQALLVVSEFASLLATFCAAGNKSRFAIIMEPEPINNNPNESSGSVIQLVCLDASLAIAPLFQRFNSVVITSSTLSPIDLYPKLLQFKPCVSVSLEISQFRPCIRPLMISRGSDQLAVSTKQDDRVDIGVIRNFGAILVELCSCVPDGIVAYFTSYSYMEALISEWDGMGILRELTKHKLVIIETKNVVETTIALDNFRVACDSGRGAVFLAVVRGMVSEGVPFDRHYGRAKIMFGLPYQYTLSHIVRARLEYLQTNLQIREQDFLTFDAIRQVAKCFGRILRSKSDYGLLIFADSRFSRMDKRSQLPKWMVQSLSEAHLNLSTDVAVQYAKSFLRIMGQPIAQEALQSVLLKLEDVRQMEGSIPNASTTATSVPLMAISSQPLSKTEPVGV
uniref:DNA 5'-3' helicase n=1 Tax=Proboscia inermis TaxID=420281 RepID=A0A7S0CC72_9STRA